MSDLLGMSIDNACEHHSVINVKVGVQENFHKMHQIVEQSQTAAEAMKDQIAQIMISDVPLIASQLARSDAIRKIKVQEAIANYQTQV